MIEVATSEILNANQPITSCDQIKRIVEREQRVKLSTHDVQKVIKQNMGLTYRRVRKVPVQANSERCLVLRQQYALAMLPMLESRTRVLNIDETWLNETSYIRRAWCKPGTPGTVATRPI